MKRRAGEWRSRLLLATFSTALTLGLAEVGARVLLRPAPPPPPDGTPISEISPTLGWRTRANGAQRIRRGDFEVTIAINSLGLRGPELPYEPAPGARRLAIMGDSFAHGYYAEEPETLRGRLDAALKTCRVDVLNAGGPGYSTDQEWIYFLEEIRKYRPSEVVLLFYYNDLQFNIDRMGTANREKPLFLEKDGELQLVLPETDRTPLRRGERTLERRRAPTFHGSALWSFAASRLQRSRPDWSRRLSAWGLAPDLSSEPPAEYLPFAPLGDRERASVEEMWKRTAAILKRFRDDVRGAGAGFTVFYVPARFEANEDAWAFVQRRYGPDRQWTRDAVRTRLQDLLVSLDIPMVDALPSFQAAERTGPAAYLAVDGHWNARGNEIAFESLFPLMRRAFSCGS
ncbi:MAG TPA: SGNH/GDSL hydrolase family protein [Vicinamibacteria bacterium]|nr:SGNH/GDSL hydrolase family protein [Vicinamibacteria bacterium]